ncbi:hypothetical protein BS78_02G379500 [Paspalum vaginatum]|nr:hypothetical protein BS78_02G379500 [Paspalum vaginatum]
MFGDVNEGIGGDTPREVARRASCLLTLSAWCYGACCLWVISGSTALKTTRQPHGSNWSFCAPPCMLGVVLFQALAAATKAEREMQLQ